MSNKRILDFFEKINNISDISINEEIQETEKIKKTEGFFKIGSLRSRFVIRETPVMDIITSGYIFEYNLKKKEKKETILEIVNNFNRTKAGIKAFVISFTKGQKLHVFFSVEIISPKSSDSLGQYLELLLTIISSAPDLFSKDLTLKNVHHDTIIKGQ